MSKEVPRSGTRTCTKEQEKRASLLFNLVEYFVWVVRQDDDTNPNYIEYDFRLQKKVEMGPKASPRTSPKASPKSPKSPKASPRTSPKSPKSPKASPRTKSGGGAKRTLRKLRRKTRTRK